MKPATRSTRLARADALIFVVAWSLLCGIRAYLTPGRGWKNEYEDELAFGAFLLVAMVGCGVIYWRVRRAYAIGAVSIWRSATEGFFGAAVVVLTLLFVDALVGVFRGWLPFDGWRILGVEYYLTDYVVPCIVACLLGAAVGTVLWGVNRVFWSVT